nr:PTS sugar transporter subunit IIB [Galbitalea soli]
MKVNAERVLQRLGLEAEVSAVHLASLQRDAAGAQIILTSPEFVEAIGKTNADIIVVHNYFDTNELSEKLEAALG